MLKYIGRRTLQSVLVFVVFLITEAVNPLPECRLIARYPWLQEVSRTNDHPALEDMGDGYMVACYVVKESA